MSKWEMSDYEKDFYDHINHDLELYEMIGGSGTEIPLMTLNQKYPYAPRERIKALKALRRNVEIGISRRKSLRRIIWAANRDSNMRVQKIALKILSEIQPR